MLRYLKNYPQREDLLKLLTGFEKFKEKIPMRNSIVMLIICFSVVLVCNVIEAKLLMFDDFKGGKINDNSWRKEGGVKAEIGRAHV